MENPDDEDSLGERLYALNRLASWQPRQLLEREKPMALPQRQLGHSGPLVSSIGFGAMGLSGVYGKANDRASIATVQRAIDLGVTLIDTADIYGDRGHNEGLIGRAISGRRNEIILATKFGGGFNADGTVGGLGRPEIVAPSLESSLRRLKVDHVDIFYLHRVDPETPIEDTVGAMGNLVTRGLARFIGLSEAGTATIKRAHAIHPITVLQSEYSLFTRDPEVQILPLTQELGIGFVAYSPLGRGLLSRSIQRAADVAPSDWRATVPRFQGPGLDRMIGLAAELEAIALPLGLTSAQLALAWLLTKGRAVVPLPGTRRVANLESNIRAATAVVPADVIQRLELLFPPDVVPADRYPPDSMVRVNL
jgi:aryl-alcohol dehydrogenase-like predicted oxidoreductase